MADKLLLRAIMTEFAQGQRWVVDSEPELGLGIVTGVDSRTITMFFEQAETERQYAKHQAPLTRIKFGPDDEIVLADGSKAIVRHVEEIDGVLIYDVGAEQPVVETALSGQVQLCQPLTRLLTGQLDKPKWFYFRRELDGAVSRTWRSGLNGLLGVRANLIPHQLYVAHTACNRESVRVLLADEVGLGKTIEAGLILSRLMRHERVGRVLILVPDALQVQWLVELVRRFAIKPELFRGSEHDFHAGQVHIVPHSALQEVGERLNDGEFDLAIVDEAHQISAGTSQFSQLESLAAQCQHLVLLTATPEQLGVESHFQRLKLLDPAKFTCFDEFVAMEKKYIETNERIKALPEGRSELIEEFGLLENVDDAQTSSLDDTFLINQMLDCHGVGRVMYRNVRKAVQGFPNRIAVSHPLESDSWEEKYAWLASWVTSVPEDKVLVIFHKKENVEECADFLWVKHGVSVAVFHEDQNLIERDKAAAFFADTDVGSQLLLCSEIGSEGRNFQFSCHLVCMDLPTHPDLLEQRIGRLDRIGQTRDVKIHIPFASNSETARRFYWQHKILNCIEIQNPAASAVHDEYWPQLMEADWAYTDENIDSNGKVLDLFDQARSTLSTLTQEIQDGRDALLELNSCRQPQANDLTNKIAEFEQVTPLALVELASDLLQFHFEQTFDGIYSLIPADKMLLPALPGFPAEGAEVTFSREIANSREDILFLSWDAPFIFGLWEAIHHSELGSASVATLNSRQLPEGHCLLEACFDIVIQSSFNIDCLGFLPTKSIRTVVLDVSEKDLSSLLPEASLKDLIEPVQKHIARDVIKAKKAEISKLYTSVEMLANESMDTALNEAKKAVENFYGQEVKRLEWMERKNPAIDQSEIAALTAKHQGILNALSNESHLQLTAIRLMVTTRPS